jgi:hypothetical protein
VTELLIAVGPHQLSATLEHELAPKTCARFMELLPFEAKLLHVRWSGEACWIPMGNYDTGLGYENHTSHPYPGQVLWYPGGFSETEILLPYGGCHFASVVGPLAANHFLTIHRGAKSLAELGRLALWSGAQDITFTEAG